MVGASPYPYSFVDKNWLEVSEKNLYCIRACHNYKGFAHYGLKIHDLADQ
ncbi:hypothetical protein A11S_99 [Micavibrio aeruginosavorus EPB]|uniref:Uncharacterized protein n=1 Tax=Micavibrio aeruginosavorus EPB TaxID=349215 RepID=M4VFV9_9BACT|nr:hypothetical protein A11S_99 [Micavibrio aeruginosavorus EPB]